ncbi:uncharacterized protein LOC118755464 [Rhagoletis pomonella]|uniref:uncharacterized protein LOC118755464 n=1 Tax=Rhagoletis pomonella TaxID=28610 RepID=UPI00177F1616|nr:uncharacterized protein LOC118755464 [Rhagoletis pomonella]
MKRLLRVTSYIFRFLNAIKTKHVREKGRRVKSVADVDELTYKELKEAECYWIRDAQRGDYEKEIGALQQGLLISSDSKLLTLNPILENDVLVLTGRLHGVEFGNRHTNPIILPKHSRFSQLIIIEAHKATLHGGVNAVLSHIRKNFWIVQGRQLIKNILQRCVICKRLYGKSASEPWTVLPAERIATARVFETTGVDFAGPLYVKTDGDDIRKKVYIMLFTCAAIRAVHLELVADMTVNSCIEALRRFIARRGTPKIIISDNARTFKRADLELRKLEELVKKKEVLQLAAHKGITWRYIPERAAWWGGFWERLVRSVKNALKASIGRAVLTSEELRTLLTEVESVVNARPLTYITNDDKDLEPLTPSNFLIDCNSAILATDFQSDGSTISQAWTLRQALLRRYMKRWREEYLQQLRYIHHNKSAASRSIGIGDVVLVKDDNKPRLQWKLAVVQTTYQGRDGRIRVCDVRMQGQQVLKRPIQLLYPLEISSSIAGPEDVEN